MDAWGGAAFRMEPGDPRLEAIHHGAAASSAPLDNLVGAVRAWQEHPDWMDFLDPMAPNHADKLIERGLYLDRWSPFLTPGSRVLDLGGGVGRFTTWLLDQGCEVEVVDPDLRSLWRCVQRAVGRPGRIDVHWSTGECLPDVQPVDAVIAAEVLCYVEEPAAVCEQISRVLKPGGHLLCSVEARWGWAMGPDVQEGTIESFLGDGIVHRPGHLWVRTYTEDAIREQLSSFELVDFLPTHYCLAGPFENATGPLDLPDALALESRLRAHPVSGPLNRAWTAVARKI
jgi:SAM-dependent methyltransferase